MEPAYEQEFEALVEETALPVIESVLGGNPFAEPDARGITVAYAELAASIVARPRRLFEGLARLGAELMRIGAGVSAVAPEPSDRRFSDPAWAENPFYRALMQSYLAWRGTMQDLLPANDAANWKARAQHRFAMTQLIEALAPTNFLWSNPAALKRVFDTAGQSLIDGLHNALDDFANNGGMPAQVDKRPFKVGKTLAVTPGAVVHRGELCEIIQYTPATRQVRERPVLIVPPQINKYYVMDLAPKRSLIEHAVAHGQQIYALSWRNPGPEYRDRGLDDYVAAVKEAVGVVNEISGASSLNLLAVCAGAITSTLLLGHLAASRDRRVNSATLLVAMLDSAESSMATMFATERDARAAAERSRAKGVLPAGELARTFAWLRPNDLVWNYWVNNYLMGKDPAAYDVLYWNADSTNLPAALHAGFLDLLLRNPLLEANRLTILGTPIDLRAAGQDLYLVSGLTDHICPWRAGYRAARLFGGQAEFVLNSTGHVQSLVCPPGNFKARYFTNTRLGANADDWRQSAAEHKGSWWDHWLEWLDRRAGEWREAPVGLGSMAYQPLEPAPGAYVQQRP
jgi:polyhydroxyalkanoate synthase